MANHWAITIGINQYRHLQPLMHAQNDALFLHRFLTQEAAVQADNCVLLSDLATSVGDQVVYPDKPAIAEWIETITQQVRAGDILWVSFSGYGMQVEGADYLMPIDGDPDQIKSTGIAISDLMETLSQLPTDNILLLLDINRSQGSFAGQTIGTQVIQLAQDRQISTLLSCEPEQYSHETLGVRHGLFTAALLEALQQSCTRIGEISEYISKRLPELCEHHWRPIQNPVSLIPEEQRYTQVVPEVRSRYAAISSEAEAAAGAKLVGASIAGASAAGTATVPAQQTVDSSADATDSKVLAGSGGTLVSSQPISSLSESEGRDAGSFTRPTSQNRQDERDSKGSALVPVSTGSAQPAQTNGARLRNWGLLALALLSIGAFITQQPFARTARSNLLERIAAWRNPTPETDAETGAEATADFPEETLEPATDVDAIASTSETLDDSNDAGSDAQANDSEDAATSPDETDSATEATSGGTDEAAASAAGDQTDEQPADTTADTNQPADSAETASSADTQAQLNLAKNALAEGQYSEALIILQQIPREQRGSEFSQVLTQARAGDAAAEETNASILTDARMAIQPTQASQFSDAIAKARTIPPGGPMYEQAQADIRSWSQIILDIAEGRATSGNLNGAIAAARVMPRDSEEFYQEAQERITFWQQRQQSRNLIAQAQQLPRSGQASTYQQGIVQLRQVPIEHPEYETAQRLADEWSQRIFSIAQARAAQGRQQAAIDAAILVPAGTTAYEPTQQAIRRWRSDQ